MSSLLRICKADLQYLKQLYEFDRPLHAVTRIAIGHFIERFTKKPEWEEKVHFLTLNEQWKRTGTFAMVNKNDRHILFNTLEPWPFQSLHKTLQLINYDEEMVFINFRDIFRPVILDIIRVRNLEVAFDSGTKLVYAPCEVFHQKDSIKIQIPTGYYFDSLTEKHVDKIESLWAQKFKGSHEFLSNCIVQNLSTGLFNKETQELVAWSIVLETGAWGNLQVLDKYYRKGFGDVTTRMHLTKMVKELKYDIVGHMAHQNTVSFSLASKQGFQWIDNESWIGVRPKKPLKLIPLWGHV